MAAGRTARAAMGLLACAALAHAQAPDTATAPAAGDTAAPASLTARAAAGSPTPADWQSTAGADSVAPSPGPQAVPVDPVLGWTAWPDIGRAIALDSLDGPAEILEKEEIIADRIDALRAEDGLLDSLAGVQQIRRLALAAQLEVLDDLAGIQLDGDLEFQQRLEAAREDLLQAERQAGRIDTSRGRLAARVEELRRLSLDYRHRAAKLRALEERR